MQWPAQAQTANSLIFDLESENGLACTSWELENRSKSCSSYREISKAQVQNLKVSNRELGTIRLQATLHNGTKLLGSKEYCFTAVDGNQTAGA